MFCLDNTDVLEAWASVDAKIDCIIDGLVNGVFTNLFTGTLSDAANTHVYVAGTDVAVVSATFVNTHNAAVTVSFKKDPVNGGNPKWIIPVDVSLEAGYELLFDGQRSQVIDTSGQVLSTFPLPLSVANGGTGLTSYAVGDLIYASGATTLSKLADVAVGQVLISGGVGVAPSWSASPSITNIIVANGGVIGCAGAPKLTFDDTNNWLECDSPFGIGTTTIPHGGVGMAKLAIDGTNASTVGPHVQFTTASDDYPVFQIVPWEHDTIWLMFDSYFDGAYKSSDAGSNYQMLKQSDRFKIRYDSGIAQGNVVAWHDGIVLNTFGIVSMPAVYNHDMDGETYRNLLINDSGELGYDSSP